MKYVALDLETSCLYPRAPQNILQFSMVFEDTEKNSRTPQKYLMMQDKITWM